MKCSILASLTLAICIFSVMKGATSPLDPLHDGAFRQHMAGFRQEGLRGDRTHVARMIDTLQTVEDDEGDRTLLLALAQIGDTDALPAFDHVIATNKSPEIVNYARAARARLVAEDAAKYLSAKDRSAAVTSRLLTELGLSAGDVNGGVVTYKNTVTAWAATHSGMESFPPPASVELFALRQLADVAYRDGLPSSSQFRQMDFSLDMGATLKVRLASMTHEQRISTLIAEISRKEVYRQGDDYYTQLLEDEGPLAHQAIIDKLQIINKNPDAYKGKAGRFGGVGTLNSVLKQSDAPDSIPTGSPNAVTLGTSAMQYQYVPGY